MFLISIRELVKKKLRTENLSENDKRLLEWYNSHLNAIDELSEVTLSRLERLRELINNETKGLQKMEGYSHLIPDSILKGIDNCLQARANEMVRPESEYPRSLYQNREEAIAYWDKHLERFKSVAMAASGANAFPTLLDLKTKSLYLDELLKRIMDATVPIGDREAFFKMHLREIQDGIENWRETIDQLLFAEDPVDVLKSSWNTGWKIAETLTVSLPKLLGDVLIRFMTGERLTDEERTGLRRLYPDIEKSLESLNASNRAILLTIELWQGKKSELRL